jgi:hypothetical protein
MPAVRRRARLAQLRDGGEAAVVRPGLGEQVCVAGLVEDEALEASAGLELCPFPGRLNGVAPAALASAPNGCVPSVAVSWIVTQRVARSCP